MVFVSNKHHFVIVVMCVLMVITGCNQETKSSYPSDFIYLDKNTVKTSMQKLAVSMQNIDKQLERADSIPDSEMRKGIVEELNKMESIANRLGAGTANTNHLFIDQHIDLFKFDVIRARRFIQAEPSNYYLAGKLVGSCLSCHILKPDKQVLMKHEG